LNAPAHDVDLAIRIARRLRVAGLVQGVGFRPYVWRLAHDLKLAGWVRNDSAGVDILVSGDSDAVEAFTRRLPAGIPPLAEIHTLTWQDAPADAPRDGFHIVESGAGAAATMIGHDSAVCPDCLAELFDPADRRWRYPFINCTHCGPRYTLTRRLPYDRAQTSMAAFPLCPDCGREYRDPADRRFHAEPTACPACGPRLTLTDPAGTAIDCADPVAETLRRLKTGEIVALKGLGGFHLACDARNESTVRNLRERKQRDEKPFAIMAANLASVSDLVKINDDEAALLYSPERPIVLLRKKPGIDLPGIAPGLAWLGVMLPYTPLHWLLFHEQAGRPTGTAWTEQPQDLLLVMTSANPNGEPLVIGNDEAVARLCHIADALLMHDRDIVVRADDSVVRSDGLRVTRDNATSSVTRHSSLVTGFSFIRRARGYTPRAIRLPRSGPSVLALGGHLKNTVCVTRGDEAFLSQHIGGLDNPAACGMLDEVSRHLLDILEVRPEVVAHDLHPDFFGTRRALEMAQRLGIPAIAVQHHHAHIAAIAAEHGVTGPVLGLALDGVGLGSDGTAWGGELLRVEGAGFSRLGHLVPLALPGGDRAAREPWRMAVSALHALGRDAEIERRFGTRGSQLRQILERRLNCPETTSLGRGFDAAAGLLGVRATLAYEGQAAMELEGLAERHGPAAPLAGGWRTAHGNLDLLPLLARLADETDAAYGAALFHATLAEALGTWLADAARTHGIDTVALGGGCFLNHILSRTVRERLHARGLAVLEARQAPPNDGGLSLGQVWVALQSLEGTNACV